MGVLWWGPALPLILGNPTQVVTKPVGISSPWVNPLGGAWTAEALRSRAEGAALNDAGRCCSAQGKDGCGERSGLAGVLAVPAGSNASSMDPALRAHQQ